MYSNEQKGIKYLVFLQTIISRMAQNSLCIKGWTVTLVSALLSFLASQNRIEVSNLLYIYIPVLMFASLDAYYLRLERVYRNKYLHFINTYEEGSLSIFKLSNTKKDERLRTALISASLLTTYIPILILISLGLFILT